MEQPIISNGGVQYIPQIAAVQYVYLDFDGESTSYNGEILTVDNVNVYASGYDQQSISLVIDQLNEIYSGELFFTDIKPACEDYSTIYIGKSDFLSEYISVLGISETIDAGNKIKNDNAFVFLDSSSDIGYTTHVIAHEIGHIVYGDTHTGDQKNPYNQTAAFQYYSVTGNILTENSYSVQAEKLQIKTLPVAIDPALEGYCYVMPLLADLTKLYNEYYQLVYKQNYYQSIYAYEHLAYHNNNPAENVTVKNWQVAGGTQQVLANGATASLCYILGVQSVSFYGSSNQCAALNQGSIQLWGGTATNNYISGPDASLIIMRNNGYASNNIIDGGTMQILLYGGSALNTMVKNGGTIDIIYNLAGDAYLTDTYIDYGCTLSVRHVSNNIKGTYQICLTGTTYLAGEMIFSSYTKPGNTDFDFSTLPEGYKVENYGNFIFGANSRTPYDNVMVSNINSINNGFIFNTEKNILDVGYFSVAIDSDMQCDQYRLAGNAENFSGSIYIQNIDTGIQYGKVSLTQSVNYGANCYSLVLNSSNELCLLVKNAEIYPDLQISSLITTSTDALAGTSLTLQFSLKNIGNGNAGKSVIGIYDGSQLLYRLDVDSLAAGASQQYSYSINAEKITVGTHNFRVIADIDNTVSESNEKNNELNITVEAHTPKADLLISNLTALPANLQVGTAATLNFTVKNAGTVSATATTVSIYDGIQLLGSVKLDSLAAGADKALTFTVAAENITAGTHEFRVVSDADNTVAESDESNNSKSITVNVEKKLDVDMAAFTPPNWDDCLVISTEPDTHTNANIILSDDTLYIDWAAINQGKDNISKDFYSALYLDGELIQNWITGELYSQYYIHIHDFKINSLSAGTHTLKIVSDYLDNITETNENNNSYIKTFTVMDSAKYGVKKYSYDNLVFSAPLIDNDVIDGWGTTIEVLSCGVINSVSAANSAGINVYQGGVANNTTVSGGYLTVFNGGVANSTTVNSAGEMEICSGGTANSTTVNSIGYMYILSGGVANNTTVNSGGRIYISSCGVANSTTVSSGGDMYISSGGVANSTTVNSGGYMNIGNGVVANSTIVNSSGHMIIYSGGMANITTVNSGGYMNFVNGGVASSTTVNFGGEMYIYSGCVHRGCLQIASGAVVSAYTGAKIDFTLTDRITEDGYLINNLALIKGAPTYTITVTDNLARGIYKLAQGADQLTGSISIGDGTENYGSVTVNGDAFEYGAIRYSLKNVDGDLTLSVIVPSVVGDVAGVTWEDIKGENFTVEYSQNNFDNTLKITTSGNAVDTYNLYAGTFQWRVNGINGENIVSDDTAAQQEFISDADGDMDLFFANANGKWSASYTAEHQGFIDGWRGTRERVLLSGKNKLADIFEGSTDANILVMTDDADGDALFVDDIYTAFPDGVDAQARIAAIDEIRAGAGDDVIDLTSQRFVYVGDGLTVYGGSGDDTIWATSGDNHLFGDAGNDRLVGGSGNDIIVGGIGNDSMHGGGGADTFCFGGNWGADTIEQLADGSVTLWFESGSESNWNASSLTYSDGTNSVTVSGIDNANIILKFGDTANAIAGAFDSFASEKIFEDQEKALLA